MSVKSEQKRANQEAAGIPDSKVFVAPHPEGSAESRLLKCHIGGVVISDLNLDPAVLSALDYFATDEGVAERNERPEMREPSGVTLGKDPFAKSLEQRRDDVKERGIPLYEARNPMLETAKKYAKPGMRAKYLSASKIRDTGGTGDYEVVKDAGDPVKVKGMVLGHIPEDRAKARNEHYRQRGNRMITEMENRFKAEVGPKALSDQDER